MTGDLSRGRLDFLVIPPDTTAAAAEHAFSAATDRVNRQAPTQLLDTLSAVVAPVPLPCSADQPDTEETAAWDSEGATCTADAGPNYATPGQGSRSRTQ